MLNKNLRPLVVKIVCAAIILFSLGSFFYNGVIRALELWPDVFYFFSAGQLWNEGSNVYDFTAFRTRLTELAGPERANLNQSSYTYPPSASIIFSLYARAPIENSYPIIIIVNILMLVLAFFILAYIMSWYTPVGLVETTLLIVLLANTGFGRGNIRAANIGIPIGLLILIMYVLQRKRWSGTAGFALGLTTVKPTFAPWYLVYYFLRRKYRLVIACIITGIVITILPLVLTGRPVVDSLMQMVQKMGQFNVKGDVNDLSPFIPGSALMMHFQPLVNRLLNTESFITTAISWGLTAVISLYVGYLIWKTRDTGDHDSLIDFALISTISLLSFYHRNYDLFLLFPTLVCIYLHIIHMKPGAAKRNWSIFLIAIFILICLPRDLLTNLSYTQPWVNDSYLWRIAAPFPIWANIAALVANIWIKRKQVVEAHQYDFLPRSVSTPTVSEQKSNPDAIKVAG